MVGRCYDGRMWLSICGAVLGKALVFEWLYRRMERDKAKRSLIDGGVLYGQRDGEHASKPLAIAYRPPGSDSGSSTL
jgi:uncharacterized membrane protein YdjX (TVP38/TMEM64 family)